jgi:sarcosine oxidase
MRRAEVVVVGAGVMGAATAYHAARAGSSVVLVERRSLGHAHGSSHGSSRVLRLAYPDPTLVELARESLDEWTQLEELRGDRLLLRTGTLVFGEIAERDAVALEEAGALYERLSGREAGWRWPVETAPDEQALFQPDGAVILAERCYHAFTEGLAEAGGEVIEHTAIEELAPHPGGVRVTGGSFEADAQAVVVTAGAWSAGLLQPLGIELDVSVTSETVAHYSLAGADELPAVLDSATPTDSSVAGRRPDQATYSLASPGIGLKVGLHNFGPVVAPDERCAPSDEVVRWTSAWSARRFPQVDPSPVAAETCLYTSTPDARFVIECHGRVIVGSACSGHGFKFAPAVGKRLAALARAAT